jgi:hypothetical protein
MSERPKTSRGKQHPSPDEFASYVVPSPTYDRNRDIKKIYEIHNQVNFILLQLNYYNT